MPLPSYRKRIFECCQGQALLARKRDLDRDRKPAFSKAGIQATAATGASCPRRPPPPMRVGYATTQARRPSGLRARYAGALRRGIEGLHTKRF